MNKGELIEAVAAAADLTKADATKAVEAFVNSVTRALKNGEQVSIVGFGSFSVKSRAARQGRNPKTGETIDIKASRVPGFSAIASRTRCGMTTWYFGETFVVSMFGSSQRIDGDFVLR